MAATGIVPMSSTDILAARPASVQDRWFARLYLLKPLAIAALALFWIATGLIALGPGRDAGAGPTRCRRAPVAGAGGLAHVGGALLDVALGALLLMRRSARSALVRHARARRSLSDRRDGHWRRSSGPIRSGRCLKIVPMLIATLFTLAILDER